MSLKWTLIAVLAPLLLPSPPSLSADIFRWVDEKGIVHYTDNLHNVPESQRDEATRIKAKESGGVHQPTPLLSLDKTSVPILKRGAVVIVEVRINGKTSANFVVDTGASYTIISHATAKELNIDLEKKLPTVAFQTANGLIQAPLAHLESIDVGGMEVKDLTAAIHDVFPDPNIAGLLGLNYLSHFRMDIDTRSSLLHLEKK